MFSQEKILLPEYPSILHHPLLPNCSNGDKIASEDFVQTICKDKITIEEKLDGANSGIRLHNGEPLIRNRSFILRKEYSKSKTPSQKQFRPIWSWFYENKSKFVKLEKILNFVPSVYGEWLYARHTIYYDSLPDLWLPYDIYNPEEKEFLDNLKVREALKQAGFSLVPRLFEGVPYDGLFCELREGKSAFSTGNYEGIVIKTNGSHSANFKVKMVSLNFLSDENWNKKELVKNTVVK